MRSIDLKTLREVVQERKVRANKRAKETYHLARSLGFSGAESMVLQNRSEEVIRRLAHEKELEKGGK